MALLAVLLLLLRRVPFAELVLRPARLGERLWVRRVVFAVAPAFLAPRFPCTALERPAFAPALLLVLARVAVGVGKPATMNVAADGSYNASTISGTTLGKFYLQAGTLRYRSSRTTPLAMPTATVPGNSSASEDKDRTVKLLLAFAIAVKHHLRLEFGVDWYDLKDLLPERLQLTNFDGNTGFK